MVGKPPEGSSKHDFKVWLRLRTVKASLAVDHGFSVVSEAYVAQSSFASSFALSTLSASAFQLESAV